MPYVVQGILWGAAVAVMLRFFYSHLSVVWPQRYFGPDDAVSLYVSGKWWRYLAFRGLPVALTGILAVHGGLQLDVSPAASLASFVVVHLVLGPVRAGFKDCRSQWAWQMKLQFHLMSSVIVGASAFLVWFTRDWTAWLAPSVRELPTDIWATLIALALSKLAYDVLTQPPEEQTLRELAMSRLDAGVLAPVRSAGCAHAGALESIVLAESLQRPRWVRKVESYVPWAETRGLVQSGSRRGRSDRGAVEDFVAEHRRWCTAQETPVSDAEVIYRHNPDPNFSNMCRKMRGW